jgi:asparagine synthase (glutamine-hydrolysing)
LGTHLIMCGLVGFIGNFDSSLLNNMTSKLSHRGPDSSGTWISHNGLVGLGHARLSIQDLSSAGHQPMTAHNRYILVYNGEIYNGEELKSGLIQKGIQFKSKSDTEILLHGLIQFGVDFIHKINGIFAFAFYDQEENKMIIARDRFGVKPLYYSKSLKGYLFSSEIKSLLADKSLSRKINKQTIVNHLAFIWSPGKETMFSSIEKVLPGEIIIFQNQTIKNKLFFNQISYKINNKVSFAEAVEQVSQKIQTSVKRQLVSDVPVGAFLSGGLDSSTICYFAQKEMNDKLNCFTIKLNSKELKSEGIIDDYPYAKKVADFLGVNLNVLEIGSDSIKNLEKVIYHLDEPTADPAVINTLLIAEHARSQNIKVLLSGTAGDDLFTGYRRHFALTQEKYWSHLPSFSRTMLKNVSTFLPSNQHFSRRVRKAFAYADLSDNERLASYFLWSSQSDITQILNKDFINTTSNFNILTPLLNTIKEIPSDTSKLNKMLYLEMKHFLADHNLNYTDKMTMATGVEARVPFLDNDLFDYVATLPDHFKQNGNIGKFILKESMKNKLPQDIIYRPKTGFGAPLRRWLKVELKDHVQEFLSKKSLTERGFFSYSEVQKILEKDQSGKIDASYMIFGIICQEMWMRQFVDNN